MLKSSSISLFVVIVISSEHLNGKEKKEEAEVEVVKKGVE